VSQWEPNDIDNLCTLIDPQYNFMWTDADCTQLHGYVCQQGTATVACLLTHSTSLSIEYVIVEDWLLSPSAIYFNIIETYIIVNMHSPLLPAAFVISGMLRLLIMTVGTSVVQRF